MKIIRIRKYHLNLRPYNAPVLAINLIFTDLRKPMSWATLNYAWNLVTEINTSCPFYKHGLTLIPARICLHMLNELWDEITFPFLNFNGSTVKVYEWISNFTPHIIMCVITYPCWD